MTNKSKSIRYINWETEVIQPGNEYWVLPQLVAQIGSNWPIIKVGDCYSATETIKGWAVLANRGELVLDGVPITLGSVKNIVAWMNTTPRGSILTGMTQTKDHGVRWSAPVPLVLSAFKEFRGVLYNRWDWKDPGMAHLVDKDIWEWSSHFGVPVGWSVEDLLQFRVGSLEVKTGKYQGTARKPESTSQVYGVTDPDFKRLPRLMKLSLCQLWCFHPSIRTDLMITNHMDLDNHPQPLVDSEVVHKPSTTKSTEPSPWDV